MSVQDIIRRRRDALVAALVRDPLIQVQVETPFALPRLAFIEDGTTPASPGAKQEGFRLEDILSIPLLSSLPRWPKSLYRLQVSRAPF